MTQHDSLAAALAAFQANLPRIGKDNTGNVRSEKGNYSYKYADLPEVSKLVLPLLAQHGMSYTALPTLDDQGRFVLEYTLRHVSGGSAVGRYPLPTQGSPQQIGSAITYARRYTLCAVTGIAPDEDDDGAAAEQAYHDRARDWQQKRKDPVSAPRAVKDDEPHANPAEAAKAHLLALVQKSTYTPPQVNAEYASRMKTPLGDETDAGRIEEFTELFRKDADAVMGKKKAAA